MFGMCQCVWEFSLYKVYQLYLPITLSNFQSDRIDRMKQSHALRDKSEKEYVSADALLSR